MGRAARFFRESCFLRPIAAKNPDPGRGTVATGPDGSS